MTTQTAIALYILGVTACVVLCAALHNVASKRKREARRVNLKALRLQSAIDNHKEWVDYYDQETLDPQPSQDAYERGRLRGRVK